MGAIMNNTITEVVDSIDFSWLYNDLVKINKKYAEKADKYIYLYRCILKIAAMYPLSHIAPPRCVDDLLHIHILNTEKYKQDCEKIFGEFVHHNPYANGTKEFLDSWKFTIDKLRECFQISVSDTKTYTDDELEPVGCWLLPRNSILSYNPS
jgi:hypothetical protein